ncbi:MAG: PKD domain-containing protein, partial [Bacteroidota bacterium]
FTRFVKLPALDEDNIDQLVAFEAQQHVPFPIDEVVWDFTGATLLSSSNDSLILQYEQAGSFTTSLTLLYNNGEEVTTTQNVQIANSPTANFSFTENLGLVSFTNQSSNGDSYLWDFGDNNTSTAFEPTHQYNAPGDYEVTLNVSNGICSRAFSQLVDVAVVSNTQRELLAAFTISPNPSAGIFQIDGPSANYQLLNQQGQLLQKTTYKPTGLLELNLKDLSVGVYYLRLTKDGQTVIVKLIKVN